MFCKLSDLINLELRCSVDETGFTESLRAGNIPVGSGFSPGSQWKFTSLAPITGWNQKCLYREKRGKKNPNTAQPTLPHRGSGEALSGWNPSWLAFPLVALAMVIYCLRGWTSACACGAAEPGGALAWGPKVSAAPGPRAVTQPGIPHGPAAAGKWESEPAHRGVFDSEMVLYTFGKAR